MKITSLTINKIYKKKKKNLVKNLKISYKKKKNFVIQIVKYSHFYILKFLSLQTATQLCAEKANKIQVKLEGKLYFLSRIGKQ